MIMLTPPMLIITMKPRGAGMKKRSIRRKIGKIYNFMGFRIPGNLLKPARLSVKVEMRQVGDQLLDQPLRKPRKCWQEQFKLIAANHDDTLLDEITHSAWDEEEWTW